MNNYKTWYNIEWPDPDLEDLLDRGELTIDDEPEDKEVKSLWPDEFIKELVDPVLPEELFEI